MGNESAFEGLSFEILAGAMKEAGGYALIGETTFGKGTVQQAVPMDDGSNIKLTLYKWLTPEGNWIHGDGIKPTVAISQPALFDTHPLVIEETLKQDMAGDQIGFAQQMLKNLGYDPGRTDGYYDLKTEIAVKAFQSAEGLKVTGNINKKTAAKLEEEVAELDPDEKQAFLEEMGVKESGLDQLVKACYRLLGLISFLTAGPKEVRAWTITRGTKAPQAAGKIHSDFERGFIRAAVVPYETLVEHGSIAACREKGLVRSEGKEYVMQDGDVVEFFFNV